MRRPPWPDPIDIAEGTGRDWRQGLTYDRLVERDNPAEWAWEFLRRNPRYQEAWKAFSAVDLREHEAAVERERHLWRIEGGPWNPRVDLSKFSTGQGPAFLPTWGRIEIGASAPSFPAVSVEIDLSMELREQLEWVEKTLRRLQRSVVAAGHVARPRRIGRPPSLGLRIRYLRILDADAAGANPKEIAGAIYSRRGTDLLRTDRLRARRLCWPEGYEAFLVPEVPTFLVPKVPTSAPEG